MKICAIDFESTGVDTSKDRITEIGAVFFRSEADGLHEDDRFSALVYTPGQVLSEEVIQVTGITDDMLVRDGVLLATAVHGFVSMLNKHNYPEAFIAHNKSFDENLWKAELSRLEGSGRVPAPIIERLHKIPWLCSIVDIVHPEKSRSKKLSHLALDYGVPVDPRKLHRAVDDCLLLVEMLSAAKVDFRQLLERSQMPDVIIRAIVPSPFGPRGDGGKGKDKAKACGFGWQRAPGTDGPEFASSWVKKVKENEVATEKEKLGYEIAIVSKECS